MRTAHIPIMKPAVFHAVDPTVAGVFINFDSSGCGRAPLKYGTQYRLEITRKGLNESCALSINGSAEQWPAVFFPFDSKVHSLDRGQYLGTVFEDCDPLACEVCFLIGEPCKLSIESQPSLCGVDLTQFKRPGKPLTTEFTGCSEECPPTPCDTPDQFVYELNDCGDVIANYIAENIQ